MATKKAASTKKASVRKSAAKSSSTNVQPAKVVTKAAPATTTTVVRERRESTLPSNLINIVFAELVATFLLTLVAVGTATQLAPLYLGIALLVLVIAIGSISGAHLNPAVTFGLWSMRRLKSVLVPFYWGAQLLGGVLAVVITNWLTSDSIKLSFDHFTTFSWPIFGVEFIGTAVLMFGIAAALSHRDLTSSGRATGIGLSFALAAVVAGSLLTSVQSAVDTSSITDIKNLPHELRVKSATLNPAIAIAATEAQDSSFTGAAATAGESQHSRFSAEVIFATLLGAALGGNLYLLVANRLRD